MCKGYLIKFIKECYLDDLLDNFLYMNAAGFFANSTLENAQGDIYECPASNKNQIFIGRNYPIWCCSYFEKSEVEEGYIAFDKRIISDFFDQNDKFCCVIMEESSFSHLFEEYFKKSSFSRYSCEYGSVDYIKLGRSNQNDAMKYLLAENKLEVLFRKRSDYAYQREYRIAFACSVEDNGIYHPLKFIMPGIRKFAKVEKEYICDSEKIYIKFE